MRGETAKLQPGAPLHRARAVAALLLGGARGAPGLQDLDVRPEGENPPEEVPFSRDRDAQDEPAVVQILDPLAGVPGAFPDPAGAVAVEAEGDLVRLPGVVRQEHALRVLRRTQLRAGV